MKIAFDYQVFSMQSFGGISRYIVRLAQGLLTEGVEIDVLVPLHRNRHLRELPSERVHGFDLHSFLPKTTRLINIINRQIGSIQSRKLQPALLHETYYTANPINGAFQGRILTVHDMIHEKFADQFSSGDTTSLYKRLSVSRADHIICVSQSTKNDLCHWFNVPDEKVSVVHHGFDKFINSDTDRSAVNFNNPFLLYVGNRGGYKNFGSLLKAVASRSELLATFEIVAFGGGPFTAHERSMIENLGFRAGSVHQIAGNDSTLGELYRQAHAFVYPSLYEGFGLPPLEAMAQGCPVITSDTSSMPEVVGPAGEYFSPTDIDAQAEAISNVVFDTRRRDELILQGNLRLRHFSWAQCAKETSSIYNQVICDKAF